MIKVKLTPFEASEINEVVVLNDGYVFDLGNQYMELVTESPPLKGARRLTPIDSKKKFSSEDIYLLLYKNEGCGDFVYKCKISDDPEERSLADEKILIRGNKRQYLSDNLIYSGSTTLLAGDVVLTKIDEKDPKKIKYEYTALKNDIFDPFGQVIKVEEKTFKDFEIKPEGKSDIKYIIYYRVSTELGWKPRKYSESEIKAFKDAKRKRLAEDHNKKEQEAGGDDFWDIEDAEDPRNQIDYSISAPWGIQDLDPSQMSYSVTIEFKPFSEEEAEKNPKDSLLSSEEKKNWEKIYSGEKKTLVSILRIAYICEDGKIISLNNSRNAESEFDNAFAGGDGGGSFPQFLSGPQFGTF